MKTKILICVLAIGLAVALIGGSTAAWFTDDAGITAAEFSKGTVEVSAEGPECYPAPKKSLGNVKPGDCRNIEWTIINKGTKDVELRVKLEGKWLVEEGQEQLSTDNVYYAPPKDSGWEIYYEESGEDKGIWLYYTQGPVQGTFGLEDEDSPASVPLPIIVAFDLYSTDNEYQGKTFELSGTVYAIQASNEAPSAVWDEAWDEVMDADYEPSGLAKQYLEYIQGTKCWNGGEDDDDNGIVAYDVHNSTKINIRQNKYYSIQVQIKNAKREDDSGFTGTADIKVWYNDIGRENWEHTFTGEQFNNGNTKNLHTPDMEFDPAPSTDKENIRVEINGIVKDGNNLIK